jgi:hypothetical protein
MMSPYPEPDRLDPRRQPCASWNAPPPARLASGDGVTFDGRRRWNPGTLAPAVAQHPVRREFARVEGLTRHRQRDGRRGGGDRHGGPVVSVDRIDNEEIGIEG